MSGMSPVAVSTEEHLVTALEMAFPEAIAEVIHGRRVTRKEWNDPSLCVFLARFDREYLVHRKPTGILDSLILTGEDLRATDWVVVREN